MLSLSSLQPSAAVASSSRTATLLSHSHHIRHIHPSPNVHFLLRSSLRVRALDAAQPFDYEAQLSARFAKSSSSEGRPLKIAIVGFGNFGQFLSKALVHHGHTVLAHSRSDYSAVARELKVKFFLDPDDLCEQHPDVILLCTSIISTETVLRSLPLQRLRRNTLFVDVLSVKEFPKNLFLQILPFEFDILCTHPMFGPQSGKVGWKGLNFVYDKVRIGDDKFRTWRCNRFLDVFSKEGCNMVEMSCGEHDRHAAGSQFITHTVGRFLEKLRLERTLINTKGYESLLELVDNTASDSFDLYYGLFMYNKNSMEQLERLDMAFEALKKELFGHLHVILRNQLFGQTERFNHSDEKLVLSKFPRNETALLPLSDSVNSQNMNGIAFPPSSNSEDAQNKNWIALPSSSDSEDAQNKNGIALPPSSDTVNAQNN